MTFQSTPTNTSGTDLCKTKLIEMPPTLYPTLYLVSIVKRTIYCVSVLCTFNVNLVSPDSSRNQELVLDMIDKHITSGCVHHSMHTS